MRQQQQAQPRPRLVVPPQVRDALRDSSWVTMAWDWFQTLLGRAVEAVLWSTMVFNCYQLIPGVAQPDARLSSLAFILQFVALDVGGLGLNKLAQQQGLARWSYARLVAYTLIGITLVTMSVAGLEHTGVVDPQVKAGIEITLVMARSIMTVLYGQAIHSLKHEAQSTRDRIADLQAQVSSGQQEVSTLRRALDSGQQEVSRLRVQIAERQQAVDALTVQLNTLAGHLDSGQQEVSTWKQQAQREQSEVSTLRTCLTQAQAEAEGVRAQLGVRQQELDALRRALESEQERAFSLSQHLDSGHPRPPVQVSSRSVSSGHRKMDSGQVIALDPSRSKRKDAEGSDSALLEQVRTLLQAQPGLSARAIAARLGCSPTTAAKWKSLIQGDDQAVND